MEADALQVEAASAGGSAPAGGSGGAPGAAAAERWRAGWPHPSDLLEITKPRITAFVLVTAAAGFLTGSAGGLEAGLLLHTLLGTALLAGGTNALNQVLERRADGRMDRTRGRPLPAGRLGVGEAGSFAGLLVAAGTLYLLAAVNALTAALGFATAASYALLYTPLKKRSSLSTLVGAVPGALPALGGWTAVRGEASAGGWALFGILFLWQVPHVLALGWLHREDYRRAGFRFLAVQDPDGWRSRWRSVAYVLVLVPVSLAPAVLNLAGAAYFGAALLLGVGYLAGAARFARGGDRGDAGSLFVASLLYLPLLLAALVLDGPATGHALSGAVAWLADTVGEAHWQATLNAGLNGTAALFLAAGWRFVRRGDLRKHRAAMLGAVAASAAFLTSYVIYHFSVGSVPYEGGGWVRTLYFAVLVSHVVLAAAVVPLVAVTLYRVLKGRRVAHRKIARWTLPVWGYVSVTGLVVYGLLYGG